MSLKLFLERMRQIVNEEKRPFSFKDFLFFEYNGITHKFDHGTVRNYFSILKKQGKIEHLYTTSMAFYTLTGVKVGKPVTHYRAGGSYGFIFNHKTNRFSQYVENLPMDESGVHNIRLRFTAKGLWKILPMCSDYEYLIKNIDMKSNRDIVLYDMDFKDHVIKATIHKTDTVEVIVVCSENQILLDLLGLARLNSSLTRLEERLQRVVDEYLKLNLRSNIASPSLTAKGPIPDHMSWTVTMWHFGRDSLVTYRGEMFEISWKDALGVFNRIYSKEFKNKKKVRIRKEVQEYPNKPLSEAFMEKIQGSAEL
ncbi:hypothetical protein BH23THE1_BH23THE1_13560 [soil metagenome]